MSWLYLAMAILFEVSGTTCMKLSQGFTRVWPSVLMFVLYGMSFSVLTLALKKIELGVAYAIWAGVGTALIALVGYAWFQESMSVVKLISIGLVILGVIGLNLGGSH